MNLLKIFLTYMLTHLFTLHLCVEPILVTFTHLINKLQTLLLFVVVIPGVNPNSAFPIINGL